MKNMTAERIDKAIARFSDPQVNYQVWLASTPEVAKVIIKGLPGVKELVEVGPDAARSMITLLDSKEMQKNDRVSAIALYVLSQFPSEEVKQALAKDIAARRFRGISSQLAAEAFLTAARIDAPQEEAITVALREAKKLTAKETATEESASQIPVTRKHD